MGRGKARQHLQSFLLRHGRIYPGKKGWTKTYRCWLTTVRFAHPAQQIVLQDCIHSLTDAEARIDSRQLPPGHGRLSRSTLIGPRLFLTFH
ncbi:hypothetical protein RSWS8N_15749 [Cereibacter sphaeroides WS8N]|nr:hypothetical protein RSWS8N_15749 [Cereibacter sphaeroides WS8N]